jgi:hypothetical protein
MNDHGLQTNSISDLDLELMRLELEADTGHVIRLLLNGRGDEVDPYLETRDYVARVIAYRTAKAEQ